MPTYEASERFKRQFARLTPAEQVAFLVAVGKFVHDLRRGQVRKSLRVKRVKSTENEWKPTWAPNGRAVFEYGAPIRPGHPHVVWQRIGGHDILDEE